MERPSPHLDIILENRTNEEWKDVVGYDGYYSVSNFGRVRSESRIRRTGRGNCFYYTKPKILKQYLYNKNSYASCCVNLSIDSKAKTHSVSILVANAFLGLKEGKQVVMHINKVVYDNNVTNLKIVSVSESQKRNYELGLSYNTLPSDRDKLQLGIYGVYENETLIARRCNVCNQPKPLDEFYKDLLCCKNCLDSRRGRNINVIGVRRAGWKLLNEGLQKCARCHQIKPLADYGKDKHRRSGYTGACRKCIKSAKQPKKAQ